MIKHSSIKIVTGITLLSVSTFNFAANTNPTKTTTYVTIPDLKPGIELSASVLYLQPNADNLGWAVVTTFLPVTTPTWRVQTIQPTYQAGFNVGARYAFARPGIDLQASWSHLRTSDSQYVAVNPATHPDHQWISPFSQTGTPPEGGEVTGIASLKVANANVGFNYDVVNLDAGKIINFGPGMQTRFFTGLSGVRIKEQLKSTFHGFPLPILSFNNTTSYIGIGPRLGLYNAYDIYQGLNFICQFAGSLLVGEMQPAQYKFSGSSAALAAVGININNEAVGSPNATQMVPAVDAKIGFSYIHNLSQDSKLTFELGYMGALYVNALSGYETSSNVLALDTGSLSTSTVSHTQSNFSVGGPYLTGSWAF